MNLARARPLAVRGRPMRVLVNCLDGEKVQTPRGPSCLADSRRKLSLPDKSASLDMDQTEQTDVRPSSHLPCGPQNLMSVRGAPQGPVARPQGQKEKTNKNNEARPSRHGPRVRGNLGKASCPFVIQPTRETAPCHLISRFPARASRDGNATDGASSLDRRAGKGPTRVIQFCELLNPPAGPVAPLPLPWAAWVRVPADWGRDLTTKARRSCYSRRGCVAAVSPPPDLTLSTPRLVRQSECLRLFLTPSAASVLGPAGPGWPGLADCTALEAKGVYPRYCCR
jgi:hypothetical protein